MRRRRCRCHHDSVAAIPRARAYGYDRAVARARCGRSLFGARPSRRGCRRPRTCGAWSAVGGRGMTLSHAHNRPRKPARAVVLGAGGFLRARLLKACTAADIAAVGLSSRDIDLADASAPVRLAQQLRPEDVLIFLAALTPDKGRDSGTLMRNLAMARAVCEVTHSAEIAQLVYASSDAVYSFATALISEETPAVPLDLYGAMHRTRELILAGEAKAPLAILRLTPVDGAGDTHNSYGPNRFLRQALKDGRIALFGNGEETRDHLQVDDAVDLIVRVVAHAS